MRQRVVYTAILGLSIVAAACGKKDEPVMQPTPTSGVNQDSIDRARADSIRNAQRIQDSIRMANAGNNAAASREEAMRVLTTAIHFAYDASTISGNDQSILDQKAAILQANPGVRIRITGHCDERGSDEYNLALGMNRAIAAKEYLVRRGVDGSRIDVASLGREVPVDPSSNEAAWAQNRRDEFDVTAGGSNLMPAR